MVADMAIPKGYKKSVVGLIPQDWEVKRLGDVASFQNGKAHEKDISEDGKYIVINSKFISSEGEVEKFSDNCLCPVCKEDVAMVMSDVPNGRAIAKCFYVDQNGKYTLNQRICSLKAKEVDSKFLFYQLNRNPYYLSFDDGVKQTNLRKDDVLSYLLKFPPTKIEQTAIATVLSDADALISSLEELIAKKRNIKQGVMQELLTGKKRLPGFSGKWTEKKLGDIGKIAGAGVDKKTKPGEVPVRLVNYLDVFRRNFIYSKELHHSVTAPSAQAQRCAVKKGDIFFTPSSETRTDIAISAVAMEDIADAAYSYHVVRLRLFEDWDYVFRTYISKTRCFLGQAETICEGSGKRYVISLTKFREMTVFYPPKKEEQTAIAKILFDMDAEIEQLEQKLDKYRMIKQGMMQELLTGKTRLI